MDKDTAKLIILLHHISDKLSRLSKDLDRISKILEESKILDFETLCCNKIITKEDYD